MKLISSVWGFCVNKVHYCLREEQADSILIIIIHYIISGDLIFAYTKMIVSGNNEFAIDVTVES
jgi:hypothetical protein